MDDVWGTRTFNQLMNQCANAAQANDCHDTCTSKTTASALWVMIFFVGAFVCVCIAACVFGGLFQCIKNTVHSTNCGAVFKGDCDRFRRRRLTANEKTALLPESVPI